MTEVANMNINKVTPRITRVSYLVEKVVIIDGQGGCGKTMVSPIVCALDRVELLTYVYEIENICSLYFLGKIELDAATALIRTWADLQLYNTMMSREVNFRPSDISSVFRDAHPFRYIRRLFQKGDEVIPERIRIQKPILHLTTHNLLGVSEPIFLALQDKIVFLEIVRHPLYMIKQQALNMERVLFSARHFTVYFQYKNKKLPFWIFGREEEFLKGNNIEKAIYTIENTTRMSEAARKILNEKYNARILTIPFERFVIEPWPYVEQIARSLETKVTSSTRKMMKRQNVPRKMYADGIGLAIYKRCGWEQPKSSNENYEFEIRRRFAQEEASPQAMQILDKLCAEYEEKYLGGRKKTGEHYA